MGMGIGTQVCLDILNAILRKPLAEKDFRMVSRAVVQCVLKNNRESIMLVHGNAIDTTRIFQYASKVGACEFVKFEILYCSIALNGGKIPWKTYREIPKENLYNMGEVATNIYYHRWMTVGTGF